MLARGIRPLANDTKNRTTGLGCPILVPVIGVEPIRYFYHRILSPARLPIPPHRQKHNHYIIVVNKNQAFLILSLILIAESVKLYDMDKMVLIDGNSLFNRAYYATPVFTTKNGTPTNAVFGFVKLLFKILDGVKPEYIVVAFDMKAPTFRHKMYDGYKSTRKPMPDDLAVQLEPLKNLLSAMKIATCGIEGIEADDILGTLSKKFDVHSYIYTGDRDSYQLVDEKTDVCYTKKGVSDLLHLTLENFKSEIGINPSQVVDLKALMGDKSDNIPGVPGIGEKTATDLLAQYGTLDGIYENIDSFKFSMREKFANNREIAYLSYKLATIDRDCNIDLTLEQCVAPKKFNSEVKSIFAEFEFKSFLSLDIFEDGEAVPEQKAVDYPEKVECSSFADIEHVFAENKQFSVVLEQNSIEIYAGGKQYTAKMQVNLQDVAVSFSDYAAILKALFSNSENKIITYDFKAILHALEEFGIEAQCDFDDLAIAKYLCDSSAANFNLQELSAYYLYDYAYSAFVVYKLFNNYTEKLKSDNILPLYTEIEKPLLRVLYEMERSGVKVSSEGLTELSKNFQTLLEEYKKRIYEACGCEFNINSPAQLAEVLYNKLGLTEVKKKKTGKFSTSAEVLEKLVDKAPVVSDILKFRLYQKLISTYCEGLMPLIDKKGLIHTTYHQTLTTTGRLSSSNPNLQNIPIREDEGRELRKIFVPHEGCVFIDADYSQIELRLLAHFSGCKELIEAYNSEADIHSITASQVFGVAINDVTPKMRREAKAVNFGIIYGISEFGLSKNINISVATAREYIQKYFETYSAVKEYMNKNVEFAHEHGYVSTLTGRKRVIPEIKSANFNIRQFGERAAMNMPLQGSSADIIKIAMINVCKSLKAKGLQTKLLLQVHDELVLEAPENEVEVASQILKYEMENAVKLSVPLTVELHTGKNWYDAK